MELLRPTAIMWNTLKSGKGGKMAKWSEASKMLWWLKYWSYSQWISIIYYLSQLNIIVNYSQFCCCPVNLHKQPIIAINGKTLLLHTIPNAHLFNGAYCLCNQCVEHAHWINCNWIMLFSGILDSDWSAVTVSTQICLYNKHWTLWFTAVHGRIAATFISLVPLSLSLFYIDLGGLNFNIHCIFVFLKEATFIWQ